MNLDAKNIIIKAIGVNSELNTKKKQVYQTIKKEQTIYFLLDQNQFDLPRIDDYLTQLMMQFKDNELTIDADLNSFINFFDNLDENQINCLLTVLVVAFRFYQKQPFSLKQNLQDNYSLKFSVNQKYQEIIKQAIIISDAQYYCRFLQDQPSNLINPISFVQSITDLFSDVKDKVNINVLDKQKIKQEGLNLLLGVNLGSNIEPRLLCIEYLNNPESEAKYGYVGKGITFDGGGMNIKTGTFMRHMKFDMSGAATVMCSLYALVKNNVKANVVAIAALTENVISPNAIRPDDIIISHAKLSVEIDNTDAEGRLVLADALSYAVTNYKVTKLVDIATLTGAMAFSLGDVYSGVWVTNQKDWKHFKKAAFNSGEYVWQLPLHETYLKSLDSKVADIANCNSSNRKAGSSSAACFLTQFTHNIDLIHLDVAMTTDANDIGHASLLKTLYHFATTQK